MLSFLAKYRLEDVKGAIDSVLLVCGVGTRLARDPALSQWLKRICPLIRRLGGVCVGSFLLAEAGVLDGKRATTHWKFGGELAKRYPQVKVESEPIWVKDGNIYTSAGISAGIDLALAWVEEDCGSALAHEIARELVLRSGGIAGRSVCAVVGSGDNGGDALWAATFLRRRGASVCAILLNPERTHSTALAAVSARSPRTLNRCWNINSSA